MEVRALLDLLRENRAHVTAMPFHFEHCLKEASEHLKVLDPEAGKEELTKSVAAELANLREMVGKVGRV